MDPHDTDVTKGTIRIDSLQQKSSIAENVTTRKTLGDKKITADVSQLQSISEMQEFEKSIALDAPIPNNNQN